MLLSSSTYFIFLTVLFFLYWPLSRWRAAALAVVLFGNYFFYAKWDLFYLGLIPFVSTCDYTLALLMDRTKLQALRRLYVTSSVLLNLGMLGAFKYASFALDNWSKLSGQPAPVWQWTFPLGISFYVFQALTYTIDVFRKDAKPTQSYLTYLAAVSFFPTTLAGPITRVSSLISQLERKDKALLPVDGGRALFLIGVGLMKKFLIADYLAENLVNRVFDFPKLYTGAEALIATYGYAFQLYFDFSGYTDIAIGSALLLGMKLPANFNAPYSAHNLSDFWRRWHISLSTWFRDYLYIPLGGNRLGYVRRALNLLAVFALSGIWHGANWTFVIWGLLHGVFLIAELALTRGKPAAPGPFGALLRFLLVFNLTSLAWVFFRAADVATAKFVLTRIATAFAAPASASLLGPDALNFWLSLGLVLALFFVEAIGHRRSLWAVLDEKPRWQRWTAYYVFAVAFAILALTAPQHAPKPFIYFQF